MTSEIWRDVDGYDGKYQISNLGRVRSFKYKSPRIMKQSDDQHGYLGINLFRNGKPKRFKVHRLVAMAFIPNPDGKPQINHRDGNKQNNHVDNLEWCTSKENNQHAFQTGLSPSDENRSYSKFTSEQIIYIRENPDHLMQKQLAEMFGVGAMAISDIQRGKTYHNVCGTIRQKRYRPTIIPDSIRNEIRQQYKFRDKQFNATALAHKYGISRHTIYRILNEIN